MLALLTFTTASAQDFIVRYSEPTIGEMSGVWARALPREDGWKASVGTQSDIWFTDLTTSGTFGDWEIDRDGKINVTNHGNLQDSSVRRCPDGSYQVVGSASVNDPNDSAYIFRINDDEGFSLRGSGPIEEGVSERLHNDMASLCSTLAEGAAFATLGSQGQVDFQSTFFHVDNEGGVTGSTDLFIGPNTEGAGMLADPESGHIVVVDVNHHHQSRISIMDESFAEVDFIDVDLLESNFRPFWPQGFIKVGDHYLVATMGVDESVYGMVDTGEIFLVVFDPDWSVVERTQITNFRPDSSDGAMRPWVARRGAQALVTFDKEVKHGVIEVELNLEAFGVDGSEDTGFDYEYPETNDSGGAGGDDTGSEGSDTDEGCGGCAAGGGGGLIVALVPLLAMVRRRR
ncbi:MAG: hypothetical protein ACI8RZ_006429 [Myxococcota bacterium]|jgi:hypothetical protein